MTLRKISDFCTQETQITVSALPISAIHFCTFTLSIYVWYLPDDHEIYKQCFRSISNFLVPELLFEVTLFMV